MSDERILITGANGFLGQELQNFLIQKGVKFASTDLQNRSIVNLGERCYTKADLLIYEDCLKLTKGITTVIHLAAKVPLSKNIQDISEVNVKGTRFLLESCLQNGVKRFIFLSSSAVFGVPTQLPANLYSKPKPFEIYGKSKLEAENFLLEQTEKMTIQIIRPRTILGNGRGGIIGILNRWVSASLSIILLDNGRYSYQLIHVKDLVNAIYNATQLVDSHIFNLGAKDFKTFHEDLTDFISAVGSKSKLLNLPSILVSFPLIVLSKLNILPFARYQIIMYSREMYFDSSNDWDILGYQPKFSNLDCLVDSFESYKTKMIDNPNPSGLSIHQKPTSSKLIDFLYKLQKLISN